MPQRDPYPDLFNPILVKELRQGLRSKSYTGILLLSQAAAAFFNFACLMAGDSLRRADSVGFMAVGLFAIFIVALPLTSINAIGGEQARDTFPLVRLTHLDGWRVLWGKWVARCAETLLLAISLLPHFILRFFLGGTDIGGELSYLAVCLLASIVFSAVAVACSVQRNWFLRIALVAAVVAGVLFSNTMVFMLQMDALAGSMGPGFSRLQPAFLSGPGSLLLATVVNLAAIAAILFWAAERLALAPVTYQPQLRVFGLLGVLVIPAAVAADWFFQGSSHFNNLPLCSFLTAPLPMVSLLILLHGFWSEPPTLGNNPTGWKRLWFFRPGWPGGVWFFCLIYLLISLIVTSLMMILGSDNFSSYEKVPLVYTALGIPIIALGSFLLWRLFLRKAPWPPWLWLVIWLIAGVCFMAWTTMDGIARGDPAPDLSVRYLSHLFFGIGFVDVVDTSHRLPALALAIAPFWAIWAGLLAFVSLRLATRQIRAEDANRRRTSVA